MTDTLILEPSRAGHVAKGRKEIKDEQLFARLIGAAVLLALAVIVLPFVLDGSGSQREYEYAETLPLEPPRPAVEKSFSSRQPDNRAAVLQAPARETVAVSVPGITSTVGLEAPSVTTASATTDATNLSSQVAAAAASGPSVISSRPTGSGTTNSGGIGNSTGNIINTPIQPGWNIQVASFVRDSNAIKLMNKLLARNLPAYTNRVVGKKRTLIRVVVGPYNNQIDALALQNRIDQDYRVESLMVRR